MSKKCLLVSGIGVWKLYGNHHKAKKALDFSYFLEHPSKIFDFALFWMAQCMFQMQLASHFNLVSMAFEII